MSGPASYVNGSIRGIRYPTGILAFDYARQVWIDTRPLADREVYDIRAKVGSASRPLPYLPKVQNPQ